MDGNLLKEIDYLTRLIKQHKQKICQRSNKNKYTSHKICAEETCTRVPNRFEKVVQNHEVNQNNSFGIEQSIGAAAKAANIHVNPNFKGQNSVIHINPKMQIKSRIHINPKVQSKPLIHVNPRIMRNEPSQNQRVCGLAPLAPQPSQLDSNVSDEKRSVYINPTLMKKLSSSVKAEVLREKEASENKNLLSSKIETGQIVADTRLQTKRLSNSNIVIASKRKLVRVTRTSKDSTSITTVSPLKLKRLVPSRLVSPYKKICTSRNISLRNVKVFKSTKLDSIRSRVKINKYKIDRTMLEKSKAKKTVDTATSSKMELVTIGGVVYKSTRNQLIRRSLSHKRKRSTNSNSDKFFVTANGKKLRRLKLNKDNRSATNIAIQKTAINHLKTLPVSSPKVSQKTIISSKVKQRSIQILHNKMRKNNQPCLLYQRFGYCTAHQKGECPKLHDKKQVSLCKRFLQGKCMLDKCPLSHDVGPEKMPTCKYFLKACCTRDACPYLHVKVSSNTPICIEFLKGYCAKGNECKRRHENVCPEFDRTGKCAKGKYCTYPHKPQASTSRQNDKYFGRKTEASGLDEDGHVQCKSLPPGPESRPRYYENTNTEKGKERTTETGETLEKCDDSLEDEEGVEIVETGTLTTDALKRPPLGSLPAYIPIN